MSPTLVSSIRGFVCAFICMYNPHTYYISLHPWSDMIQCSNFFMWPHGLVSSSSARQMRAAMSPGH